MDMEEILIMENKHSKDNIESFRSRKKQNKLPLGNLFRFHKGQMTIIAAILIVIALILLKNLLNIYTTIEEKRALESAIIDKKMLNIKDEYKSIAGLSSLHSNSSGIDYLSNFSGFILNDIDASVLYVYVFSNESDSEYSVTLGNFLKSRINATINVTGASSAGNNFGIIEPETNKTAQFDFSSAGTVNMTLEYSKNGINVTEEFRVPVFTDRSSVFGFFDITLESGSITLRSKEVYNMTVI
jgi:cell division protein FtsL